MSSLKNTSNTPPGPRLSMGIRSPRPDTRRVDAAEMTLSFTLFPAGRVVAVPRNYIVSTSGTTCRTPCHHFSSLNARPQQKPVEPAASFRCRRHTSVSGYIQMSDQFTCISIQVAHPLRMMLHVYSVRRITVDPTHPRMRTSANSSVRLVGPILLRAPQTPDFFGIFLPFIKPFRGEDVPLCLDLCGI